MRTRPTKETSEVAATVVRSVEERHRDQAAAHPLRRIPAGAGHRARHPAGRTARCVRRTPADRTRRQAGQGKVLRLRRRQQGAELPAASIPRNSNRPRSSSRSIAQAQARNDADRRPAGADGLRGCAGPAILNIGRTTRDAAAIAAIALICAAISVSPPLKTDPRLVDRYSDGAALGDVRQATRSRRLPCRRRRDRRGELSRRALQGFADADLDQ